MTTPMMPYALGNRTKPPTQSTEQWYYFTQAFNMGDGMVLFVASGAMIITGKSFGMPRY